MSPLLSLVRVLATTLVLTIAIELSMAVLAFGMRTRRQMLVVALAQVVTNPLVELLCLAIGWHANLPLNSMPWLVMLAAELAAFVAEAQLYRIAAITQHPWLMSGVLNATSFTLGLLLL